MNRVQNGVVLGPANKKNLGLPRPRLLSTTRRQEEEGEGEGGVRTWSNPRRRLGRLPRALPEASALRA